MNKIDVLYQSGRTVFSINDLRILWREKNANALKSNLKYYADSGRLFRVKKGIYAFSKNYDSFELAQKLLCPSYVSLRSALAFHGVVFQATQEVASVSLYWRSYPINGFKYTFHAIKKNVFFNPLGIKKEKNFWIATKERAIADTFYLMGETAFDAPGTIDKELLLNLIKIYGQKSTGILINKFIESL